MTQYRVITAYSASELQDEVNCLLAEGWMLQGGVSISHYEFERYDAKGYMEVEIVYAQAMVWMP